MSDVQAKIVRAFLEPLVLAILGDGPNHGYGLHKEAERLGGATSRNTIYTLLNKLEEDGLVVKAGTDEGGPGQPRSLYTLTDAGRDELTAYREVPSDLRDALARLWPPADGAGERNPPAQGQETPRLPARVTTVGPGGGDLPYPCPTARVGFERDARTGDLVLRLSGCPMGAYDYCPECPVSKNLEGVRRLLLP